MPKQEDEEFDVLHIDEFRLEEEWINQPKLYFKYARKLAFARTRLEEAKAELSLTTADVAKSVRRRPSKYGIEKLTDKAVDAVVPSQEEVLAAQSHLSKASHDVAILSAMVTALEHRKRALENLVDLHGQSYFATPRASGDGKEGIETAVKRSVRNPKKREEE